MREREKFVVKGIRGVSEREREREISSKRH